MVRRIASGLLLAAAATLVCAGDAAASRTRLQHVSLDRAIFSPSVQGKLQLAIYVPSNYAHTGRRYPVVYFLHGLPAASTSYRTSSFLATALDKTGRRAIIVAPQGARDSDSDPEYLDWGNGRNWETAITRDVVGYVDSHFRTIANRRGRALVGLSAGGYGAVILSLHHLSAFSVVESWSGYFHPTDPDGTRALDLGSTAANRRASAHTFVHSLRAAFTSRPTFFAFYVGLGDARFRRENEQLHRELVSAGVRHVFRLYPGGHERTLWETHAAAWLELAVRNLARAR